MNRWARLLCASLGFLPLMAGCHCCDKKPPPPPAPCPPPCRTGAPVIVPGQPGFPPPGGAPAPAFPGAAQPPPSFPPAPAGTMGSTRTFYPAPTAPVESPWQAAGKGVQLSPPESAH